MDLQYRYSKVWIWAGDLISNRDINFIGWNNGITEMNHSRNNFQSAIATIRTRFFHVDILKSMWIYYHVVLVYPHSF